MQSKFEALFLNYTGCQGFFQRVELCFHNYSHKLKKGLLRKYFFDIKYTKELPSKAYYIDKNLEKQLIQFFTFLSKDGNTFMQNYMKKQHNNSRSYNIVLELNEFAKAFEDHLYYPVAFDIFLACLK